MSQSTATRMNSEASIAPFNPPTKSTRSRGGPAVKRGATVSPPQDGDAHSLTDRPAERQAEARARTSREIEGSEQATLVATVRSRLSRSTLPSCLGSQGSGHGVYETRRVGVVTADGPLVSSSGGTATRPLARVACHGRKSLAARVTEDTEAAALRRRPQPVVALSPAGVTTTSPVEPRSCTGFRLANSPPRRTVGISALGVI